MALIGNNADTLLNGLSSFWHRFFRDIGDMQVTYEGTEILLGQVYLNFLSDVLNTSIVETPLFRKEYYKLITVREDQLVFREHGDSVGVPAVPAFYGNPGTDRYVYTGSTFYGGIPQLQDVVFSPKTALSEGVDYRVAGAEIQFKVDPTDPVLPGYANRRVVVATGGKFTSATVLDWAATGVEKGDTLYYSEAHELGSVDLDTFDFSIARKATIIQVDGANLVVSAATPFPTFPAGAQPSGFSWRVVRVRDDGIYNPTLPGSVPGNAPFPATTGNIVYTLINGLVVYPLTLEVNELAMWAVDAKVDDLSLYNTYGYFFENKQLSSETYRSLIRGLMQLYMLGPAMARLESALNLTAGLPTIGIEGEILAGYDSGVLDSGTGGTLLIGDVFQAPVAIFSQNSLGGYIKITASDYANNLGTFNITEYISTTQVRLTPETVFTLPGGLEPPDPLNWIYTKTQKQVVTTDQAKYEYPLDTPMRTDVTNPANFGVLTFSAFEPLTTALRVTDYVQDPQWWHNITVPQALMPDADPLRRVVTSQLFPNVLGVTGNAWIGDPGFYIGADEDGHIINPPIVAPPTRVPYRHNAAFILMDRFMKLHMFGVLVDSSVTLTWALVQDIQTILNDVKPVHTTMYFRPLSTFRDVIDLTDALTYKAVRRSLERIGIVENRLLVGSAWIIGDTWKFTNPVGGAITRLYPSMVPVVGGMFAAIGGADPLVQPADPTNIPPATEPPYIGDPGYPDDVRWIDRPLHVYMHV